MWEMTHVDLEIVLASYNGQAYIAEQLRSLQKCKGYADWVVRVLVVDDASVDRTAEIVASFAKNDPRIVWIPAVDGTQGPVANFSRGLELTRAPYVMLCDQDDVWTVHKMRLQFDLCCEYEQKCGKEDPLLIFSDLQVVDEKLQTLSPSFFSYQKVTPEWSSRFGQLLLQNVAPGCSMLLNRSLIDKALPIPPQAVMHDWWLILVARAFGHILWTDRALVKYRQHGKNQVGAQRINWRRLLSLQNYCRSLSRNLQRQGYQAQYFYQRYHVDPALRLESNAMASLKQMRLLPNSSLWQRLSGFIRGDIRKNNLLRNIGLLLVLLLWYKTEGSEAQKR